MCSPAGYRSAMPVRLTLTGSNLVDLEPCPKDSKRLESAWICIQLSLQEYGSLRHGSRSTCSPEPAVGSFTGSLSLSLSLSFSLSPRSYLSLARAVCPHLAALNQPRECVSKVLFWCQSFNEQKRRMCMLHDASHASFQLLIVWPWWGLHARMCHNTAIQRIINEFDGQRNYTQSLLLLGAIWSRSNKLNQLRQWLVKQSVRWPFASTSTCHFGPAVLAGFAPHCSTGVLLGSDDALSLPMIKYADIAWQAQEIPKIAFRCSKTQSR